MQLIKKGMVVYHETGVKGIVIEVRSVGSSNEIHVQFDEVIPTFSDNKLIFITESIGSHLFLSEKEYEKAIQPIQNNLNSITSSNKKKLVRDLKIAYKTLEEWSYIFKFNNNSSLKYGFFNDDILYLRHYHPKNMRDRYTPNPAFDGYDQKILNVKEGIKSAIHYFADLLNEMLAKNIMISVVPSSTPNKVCGMQILARLLIPKGRTDAINCLVRHTQIKKLSTGGNREKSIHLNSIKVDNIKLINDEEVLLLDDVVTTGNTLEACRELLLESGAKNVRCLVLGKTHRL